MPFTVDVGPFQGGQMYAQAGQNLGKEISDAMVGYMSARREQEADETLLNFFQQQGMTTPETMEKWQKGSHIQKGGIIAGLSRQFGMKMKADEEQRLADQQAEMAKYHSGMLGVAQAQEAREKAAAEATPQIFNLPVPPAGQTGIPYGPPTEAEAAAPTVPVVKYGPGKYDIIKPKDTDEAGEVEVKPLIDPVNQQPVPGMGIASRKGSKDFKVVRTGGGDVQILEKDGYKYYLDNDGNPHFFTADQSFMADRAKKQQQKAGGSNAPPAAPATDIVPFADASGAVHHYEVDHVNKKVLKQID